MVAGDQVPLNPFKCSRYGCRSSFRRVAASLFARCASAETLAARAWALASIARSRASAASARTRRAWARGTVACCCSALGERAMA
jgi:hypothetical protein